MYVPNTVITRPYKLTSGKGFPQSPDTVSRREEFARDAPSLGLPKRESVIDTESRDGAAEKAAVNEEVEEDDTTEELSVASEKRGVRPGSKISSRGVRVGSNTISNRGVRKDGKNISTRGVRVGSNTISNRSLHPIIEKLVRRIVA